MDFKLFGRAADPPKAEGRPAPEPSDDKPPDAQYEDRLRAGLRSAYEAGVDVLAEDADRAALWPRTVTGRPLAGRHGLGVVLTTPMGVVFAGPSDLAALKQAPRKADAQVARYGAKHRLPKRDRAGNPIVGETGPEYEDVEYPEASTVLYPLWGLEPSALPDPAHFPAAPSTLALNASVSELNAAAIQCLSTYAGRDVDAILRATDGGRLIRVAPDAPPSRLLIQAKEASWGAACLATSEWLLPKSYARQYQAGLERGKGEPTGWYKSAALPAPHRMAFETRLLAYALGVLYAGHAPALGDPDEAYAAFRTHALSGGNVGRLSVSCRKVADALYLFDRDLSRSPHANGVNVYTGLHEGDQANPETSGDIDRLIDAAAGDQKIPI